MFGCPDENLVSGFLERRLHPAEHELVARHLEGCDRCQSLLEGLNGEEEREGAIGFLELSQKLSLTADAVVNSSLERGDALGRYLIIERIGAGGMSVVYSAYDPQLDRRVALKVLRTAPLELQTQKDRLIREAKAMAQLSHPNVLPIYDIESHGESIFIVMEFIGAKERGPTLRDWGGSSARTWQEVLGVLIQAGRGLAAAHAAGLIHRDFKPDNVLVGDDDRVRVADFGLVATEASAPSSGGAESRLTSSVAGTPAYMAPEQRQRISDARSDQFSFCVTAWEQLFGSRPSQSGESADLAPADAVQAVPLRLRQALRQGLASDPAQRHESLDRLMTILEQCARPQPKRRLHIALVATLAAATIAGALAHRSVQLRREASCRASARLAGVWDDETRERGRRAFAAVHGDESWKRVTRYLDQYAQQWLTASRETCQAMLLRSPQEQDALAPRQICLDERREDLAALVDLFSRADAALVDRAPLAARELTPMTECNNAAYLTSRGADRNADALVSRRQIASIQSLVEASQCKEAVARADQLLASHEGDGGTPLARRLLETKVNALACAGDYAALGVASRRLLSLGTSAGDGYDEALGWVTLVFAAYGSPASFDEGRFASEMAAAVLNRIGGEPLLASRLELYLGGLYGQVGRDTDRLLHLRRGLDIAEQGHDEAQIAFATNNVAAALLGLWRYQEALPYLERGRRMMEAALGPDHWRLGFSELTLGIYARGLGHFDEALSHFDDARGRFARKGPSVRFSYIAAEINRAETLYDQGRFDVAASSAQTVVSAILDMPHDKDSLAAAYELLGRALEHQKRWKEARFAYRAADTLLAPADPERMASLTGIGRIYLRTGDSRRAVEVLEKAISLDKNHEIPIALGRAQLSLAEALRAWRREPERARQLAAAARSVFLRFPEARIDEVELEEWAGR